MILKVNLVYLMIMLWNPAQQLTPTATYRREGEVARESRQK